MKIKPPSRKKKPKFINGHEVEADPQYQRLPQLNKFNSRRALYGY